MIPTATFQDDDTGIRYMHGGEEFVVVELAESISLEVNMRTMAICHRLEELDLLGVVDICPANASYMVRFDPDSFAPHELVAELRRVEKDVGDAADFQLATRIVDFPVLYEDPWTLETLMRFRDCHQTPDKSDLEFAAEINGFDSVEEFIEAHCGAPYIVSMCGFVPTVPWCFQLSGDRQIEVPKYVRPRTDTPGRALGHGGACAVLYPVRGAGGYQLFGMAAAPIFQAEQTLPDFRKSMTFCRPGDIVKFRRVDRAEYDDIRSEVEAGTFEYRKAQFQFVPGDFLSHPELVCGEMLRSLYGDSGP
ncbi:MAG: carboxyltransferase domain-containing protein [Thermoleophilia bacterium]|nr:carboxyltransferase domain-containing protein [Thermoleophilia bacterium]